jgi:CO/xanthine dehydrogenase Mo-binding subunit
VNHAKPFNVIGRAHERRDGLGHVTGTTVYVDDVSFPRMCHLKMVRSPLAHARIRGIDFSDAEKVPGFVTALTARDVPKNVYTILCLIGVEPDDEPVLAEERVRYRGEQIAAVVADTEAAAAEAAAKVRLDLEELPHVLDVERPLHPKRRWSPTGGRTTSSTRDTTAAGSATETPRPRASRPTTWCRAATS